MIGTQFLGVPTDKGGAIEYLSFNLAKGLSQKEFEVTYFSVDPKIKFSSVPLLNIERFPAKKTNALFFSFFVLFKSLFKKTDAVYVSGCSMIFAGLILSKIKRTPLIYHEFNHNPWIKPNNFFYDFLARFSVKHSDYTLIAGNSIIQSVIEQTKIPEKKILQLPDFVVLDEFPFSPEKKQKKILFVARLVKHKGIDFVLNLTKKSGFEKWIFEIIFPEPDSTEEKNYLKKIKSLVDSSKKKVSFRSGISRKELIKAFSSASILVLPSSQESFGMVLAEAMACFTPCVAFSIGGTTEIIEDNINGFLVKLNDFDLFEKKLLELTQDEKKRISFGFKARKKIEEKFSFVNSLNSFEQFLKKILVKK